MEGPRSIPISQLTPGEAEPLVCFHSKGFTVTYKDQKPPRDTRILPVIPRWPGPPGRCWQDNLKDVGPCVTLAQRLRPCYGPRGLAKSLLFSYPQGLSNLPVSSLDTASVLASMNLNNTHAFTLASAATKQAMQHGDGAGLVLLLASSLLTQAGHLLALGVTGAEVQAGYRLGCGRALVLLEREVCGRLQDPREELQVRAILRPFLASWQPGFDSLLEAVVARCCVYSWKPITSGERGEVWEGVTFEPTCVRVCIELEGAPQAPGLDAEDNKEAEEEGDGKGEQETEVTGEKCKEEAKKEEEEISEKQGQDEEAEQQGEKTEREEATEPSEEIEERDMNRENNESLEGEGKENQDKQSASQEEVAKTEAENKENGDGKTREDDEEGEETNECDDWVDLGLEIWETVSGGAKDDGVVWTQEINERQKLTQATRTEVACSDPVSVNFHGNKLSKCFSTGHLMHKHITSVQYRRRLHRSKGQPSKGAHQQHSPSKTHRSPRKKHQPPRHTKPANPPSSLPLQASLVVEEPLGADACSKVSVTLRSPDQALLDSAQAAVAASLRVYHSVLAEPRLVPGAGAAEVAAAVGLTHEGLGLVGMEQLVVHAFSQALLEPAKALGENSGTPADLAVLQQYGRHWGGTHEQDQTQNVKLPLRRDQEIEQGVMDGLGCKASAIQKATKATLIILSEILSQTGQE